MIAGARSFGCSCHLPRRRLIATAVAAAATALLPASLPRAQPAAPRAGHIDVHHHYFPPPYLAPLEAYDRKNNLTTWPAQRDWSAARAIEAMDRAGVATAILSISTPGVWFGDAAAARDMARTCNDYAARLMADHPGRFGLFAVLPLPDVDGCLREIDYAMDVLHADGVVMPTSAGGRWPGDPAFAPVFEALDHRRTVAFFHPLAPDCCGSLIPGVNGSPMEYLFDSTRAIVSLLVGGTLQRCPDVRYLFSHGGGTLPMAAGRIAGALRSRPDIQAIAPDGIDRQFQRLFYDTANAFYAPTMAALSAYVPASQILFGSDYPYLSLDQNLDGLDRLALPDARRAAILADNARALLPRLA